MTRPLRLSFENASYHITARGNRRDPLFYNDTDRKVFIDKINETFLKYSFVCYAYCLMDNHYHIFLKTRLPKISEGMHYLNTSYANWFKAKHKIVGVLFQGRYKSLIVDENSYGVHLSAYIHLNPFRADIVEDLRQYTWSSYLDYVDGEKSTVRLDTSLILDQFDNDKKMARKKYEAYVLENSMMQSPLKDSYKGIALGEKAFIESIKELAGKIGNKREIPETKVLTAYTAEEIIQKVMADFSIGKEDIFNKKRGNFFRLMTLSLLKQFTSMSLIEIGELFQMDYAAVSQACKRYEEMIKNRGKSTG
ncbi:MAG: chromosomal replication initiator DnaA [Nitrospirae bacterium RBG_13_39_12]|nr:MAG: chromosomal replication initiator DnaA [Nitrospirae bacterium RBG_13_39_12]